MEPTWPELAIPWGVPALSSGKTPGVLVTALSHIVTTGGFPPLRPTLRPASSGPIPEPGGRGAVTPAAHEAAGHAPEGPADAPQTPHDRAQAGPRAGRCGHRRGRHPGRDPRRGLLVGRRGA